MNDSGKLQSGWLVSKWRKLLSLGRSTTAKPTEEGTGAERRRFPRHACELPVELHMDSPGELAIISAVAKNISVGGLLIECAATPQSLTSCHVSFRIPEWIPFDGVTERDVMTLAQVRHNDPIRLTLNLAFTPPLQSKGDLPEEPVRGEDNQR